MLWTFFSFLIMSRGLLSFMLCREYVEALEREMVARDNLNAVQKLLNEAQDEVSRRSPEHLI